MCMLTSRKTKQRPRPCYSSRRRYGPTNRWPSRSACRSAVGWYATASALFEEIAKAAAQAAADQSGTANHGTANWAGCGFGPSASGPDFTSISVGISLQFRRWWPWGCGRRWCNDTPATRILGNMSGQSKLRNRCAAQPCAVLTTRFCADHSPTGTRDRRPYQYWLSRQGRKPPRQILFGASHCSFRTRPLLFKPVRSSAT